MPTKRPQPVTKYQSHADQAVIIYRRHLKQVEDGVYDTTRSWRQSVLNDFAQSIDTAPASLSNLFINAQRKVGLRVNRDFEIEPTGAASVDTDKTTGSRPITGQAKVLVLTAPDATELTLVPRHGQVVAKTKPINKVPMPSTVPPVGADLNLTHRADLILTRGWMPTL